ncbi:MAG: Rieske 2Fe-2S domain-containing protein [Nitrososphaerota archaeon]|nr:Rieske 2Fe-2S domain-containing protein [Nitrososphaerota archaeon]
MQRAHLRSQQGARRDALGCPDVRAASQGQAASTKDAAVKGFRRIQLATGAMLLLSSAAGVYLLATDASLWLLAVSHAVGLIIIAVMDFVLGVYSLASSKSVYLPSIAAGVLGFVLQAGDVFTAPQYNMTIPYFAHYLFGLGAFDLLLALQAGVVAAGVLGRPHARYLSRRKSRSQRLDYTRRGFIRAAAGLAGLVGVGVLVGSMKLPAPTSSVRPTTTTGSVHGSVANINDLKVGTPVYFEYPAGYPNALIKNSDGTLTALSMYCTHVCCDMSGYYDSSAKEFFCPCHGSIFDSSGRVVRGPASASLPSIQLTVDSSGNVFPTGVSYPGPCQV